jgi:hypothetical protein
MAVREMRALNIGGDALPGVAYEAPPPELPASTIRSRARRSRTLFIDVLNGRIAAALRGKTVYVGPAVVEPATS